MASQWRDGDIDVARLVDGIVSGDVVLEINSRVWLTRQHLASKQRTCLNNLCPNSLNMTINGKYCLLVFH